MGVGVGVGDGLGDGVGEGDGEGLGHTGLPTTTSQQPISALTRSALIPKTPTKLTNPTRHIRFFMI